MEESATCRGPAPGAVRSKAFAVNVPWVLSKWKQRTRSHPRSGTKSVFGCAGWIATFAISFRRWRPCYHVGVWPLLPVRIDGCTFREWELLKTRGGFAKRAILCAMERDDAACAVVCIQHEVLRRIHDHVTRRGSLGIDRPKKLQVIT